MVKYLGSKRLLISQILGALRQAAPEAATILDPFSGTARVGHALKREGYRVLSTDHNAYAATLAACYVAADADEIPAAQGLVDEFNALCARSTDSGWFTDAYSIRSRYFHPSNAARIEAIRNAIVDKCLPPDLEAVCLTSLMEAADRVDSTVGVQMAYLKAYAPRALKPLELRVPDLLPPSPHGHGRADMLDALDAVRTLSPHADAVYLDPPYNQHSYLGNYHVWETLVRWDNPEVYGTACKRVDCRKRKSAFNSRPRCAAALAALLDGVASPVILLSFNNEGYLTRGQIESLLIARLARWGIDPADRDDHLGVLAIDFKRYVGAQIGIYNPAGEKVGTPGRLRNTEYIFLLSRTALSGVLEQSCADRARVPAMA